jgi:HEAT repeat protein
LELRRAAADALMLIGPLAAIAVPALMDLLEHDDELLRAKCVGALGAIGPSALSAAAAIAERLVFDDVDDVRGRAAVALGRIGSEVLPLLIDLSEDEDPSVRRLALLGMAELAHPDPTVEEALAAALRDADDAARLEAARAATRHGLLRSRCLKEGTQLLFSPNRTVSVEAAKLLEQLLPTRAEIEANIDRTQVEANPRARGLIERVLRNATDSDR